MSVQQGLDPQQITEIAQRLAAQGDQLEQMYQSGTAMMGVLAHAWAGPDTEHFAMSWQQTGPQIEAMSASLRDTAKALHQQAQDQVRASGESVTGGTTGTTGSGGRPSGPTGGRPWDGVGDFGQGLLVPDQRLIDTAKKIADHTRDGIREGADRVHDGVNEGIDRVNKGMDWLEERADEARDWGQDTAETLGKALIETALTGAAATLGGNVLAVAELLGLADDGHGTAGEVTELPAQGTKEDSKGNHHESIRRPTSVDEIMRSTSDAYDNNGTVRITKVTHPDGTDAYIVNTPGTQNKGLSFDSNPLDNQGNLATVNGGSSAGTEAVWAAMDKAGIPRGAPVLMAGHSQGGMINQALMADPRFTERFNVTHALTYGSPVEAIPDTSGARQLHLQHESDIVPGVDLGNTPMPSRLRDDSDVVTLANPPGVYEPGPVKNYGIGQPLLPPVGTDDVLGAHDYNNYADSAEQSGDHRISDFENDLDDFIAPSGDSSEVTGVDIEILRK